MSPSPRTTLVARTARLGTTGLAVLALAMAVFASPSQATVPGSNGRIAFKGYLDADRSTAAIFTVRPNGTGRTQITFPPPGVVDDQPDWAPDGSLIGFRRCPPDEACAVYTVRPDGTDLTRLTPPCDDTGSPTDPTCPDESDIAFLPDSHRIVFTRSTGSENEDGWIEHSDIVVRDLRDGSTRDVLRSRPFSGDNIQMVVSPDGGRIAFQRSNSGTARPAYGIAVFVVNLDGTRLRRITPWRLVAGDHPDWSPDGRWILFRSNVEGDFLDSQLYVAHPDGSGRKAVTDLPADLPLLSASFSPDGRRITFGRGGQDDVPDIYTVGINGTRSRPVTSTPLWESAPDWGPQIS